MSATTACIRPAGRARATMPICANRAMTRPIRGSIGPIPARTTTARLQNGWLLVHADKAARIPDEHSETPYMTRRAMDFITEAEADGRPWCLHLSYIKPHWPYIAPEPYASMYGAADVQPAIRSEKERQEAHPVFAAYMDMRYSRNMSRDEAREKVIPTYMGLIKQIDDQMGVLMQFLEARGLLDTTMIVFTSDHGDYLGDHWMGEKDLFHDQSAKIPLIVIDPSAEADSTRGTVCDALVEAIDLAPTFIDYFGGKPPDHILEGRSLMPLLHGETPADWRKVVFSEYDYSHAGRAAEAEPADRAMPAVHGVRRPLEIHPRLGFPADALRPRRAIRRNSPIAAKTRHAPMSSRGCRRRCSTGRCIPRTTSPPATRRSPPMRTTSFRSKAAS